MIEKLEDHPIIDRFGNVYGVSAPNRFEIVEKINEIIDYINQKEGGGK